MVRRLPKIPTIMINIVRMAAAVNNGRGNLKEVEVRERKVLSKESFESSIYKSPGVGTVFNSDNSIPVSLKQKK